MGLIYLYLYLYISTSLVAQIAEQLDPRFFLYVYFYSVHVSGSHMPIIRRIIVSMRHLVYVTLCRWPSGMQEHMLLHTRSTKHKRDIPVSVEWSFFRATSSPERMRTDFSFPLAVRSIWFRRRVARSADGQNHERGLEFEAGPSHYQEDSAPNTHPFEDLKSWAVKL